MTEWLIVPVLRTGDPYEVSWVQIPVPANWLRSVHTQGGAKAPRIHMPKLYKRVSFSNPSPGELFPINNVLKRGLTILVCNDDCTGSDG